MVIRNVNETGAKVKSLTQDGLRANFTMAKELGADFMNNKPYIPSPTNPDDRIYLIWDAPHCLKLARGCLKHHQLYYQGKPMHWDFIANLHKIQKERNINLGNKLTDMHLDFHVKPMSVRLAAETISKSVAQCIDQLCEDNYAEFKDSAATTQYIRNVDATFNILNFKPEFKKNGSDFRKPLNPSTVNDMFAFFTEANAYFRSLEIDEIVTANRGGKRGEKQQSIVRKLAIKSRNFTPFLGLASNLTALEGLYIDCVLNGTMKELHTFKFCQDHLETWFSSVRRALGQ